MKDSMIVLEHAFLYLLCFGAWNTVTYWTPEIVAIGKELLIMAIV